MARTLRRVRTDEVVRAARSLVSAYHDAAPYGETYDVIVKAQSELVRAVKALDELDVTTDFSGPGAFGHNSPDTSVAAATLCAPALGSLRRRLVDELAVAKLLTDSDFERRTRRPHQSVSSARNWLVEQGWIEDSGQRRTAPSGRLQIAWRFTPAGERFVQSGDFVSLTYTSEPA